MSTAATLCLVLAPLVAAASEIGPPPALLEQAATSDAGLAEAIDPARGLVIVEYFEGGDVQRARHLCGEEPQRALPEIRVGLLGDRKDWNTGVALRCLADQCTYDPGEAASHYSRYLFRSLRGGRPALYAIQRLESGAINGARQRQFVDRAMRKWRSARCPR
ncbi:MAG TPA: hypothetical protein VGP64_18115 [Polyangia bacterium]|jgi:hypothetical protein